MDVVTAAFVERIQTSEDPEAVARLLIESDDPTVRALVAVALSYTIKVRRELRIEWLVRLVEDPELVVRSGAVTALVALGDVAWSQTTGVH